MFFLLNWLENLFKPESPADLKKRLKSRIKKNDSKKNDSKSKKAIERDV